MDQLGLTEDWKQVRFWPFWLFRRFLAICGHFGHFWLVFGKRISLKVREIDVVTSSQCSMDILNFSYHSDFTWNQSWQFWCLKIYHFEPFSNLGFRYFLNLTLTNMEFSPKSNSRASKMAKITVFEPLKLPTLISRKIWMAVKFINVPTVVLQIVNKLFCQLTVFSQKV